VFPDNDAKMLSHNLYFDSKDKVSERQIGIMEVILSLSPQKDAFFYLGLMA
jgi:hypothetical protein